MTDMTGAEFWGPWQQGEQEYPDDIYHAVQDAWTDAWTHADGTTCPHCASREDEMDARRAAGVCAVLLMVCVTGSRRRSP